MDKKGVPMPKEDRTDNGIFDRMVDEAIKKVSCDGHAADVKDIVLVSFGMATRNMSEKIEALGGNIVNRMDALRRPMYVVGGGLFAIGFGWIVDTIADKIAH